MRRTLAMLLPKMFPMAISVFPLALAKIFTINSGAEVPKATIVRPITMAEILNFLAIEEAPSIKKSAPLMRMKKPMMNKIYVIKGF